MNPVTKRLIGGAIRHALTTLGGVAVAKGYIDAASLETLIGAAMVVFGLGWSALDKAEG